jgi:hypothetical protein
VALRSLRCGVSACCAASVTSFSALGQNHVFESDGIIVAHDAFMLARQHQFQLDARQFDERAFRLRGRDREAPIEIGDEMLFEVAIGRRIIGDRVMPEFLGSRPWILPNARSLRPRACGERAR